MRILYTYHLLSQKVNLFTTFLKPKNIKYVRDSYLKLKEQLVKRMNIINYFKFGVGMNTHKQHDHPQTQEKKMVSLM